MFTKMKAVNTFPAGWNESRVNSLLSHYEAQTEEEAVAEDEAAFGELAKHLRKKEHKRKKETKK